MHYDTSHPRTALDDVFDKVRTLRTSAAARDRADSDVFAVRNGNIDEIFPGMFSDDFPKPIIANFIDIAARDVAESLAPLPSFNGSATNMVSDAARSKADKKTKGMQYYLTHSNLQTQMYSGADYYASYGRMPILIEADFASKCPRWLLIDPRNSYPEIDRFGRCRSFSRVFRKSIAELCAEYPEHADRIPGPNESAWSQTPIEVVLYRDHEHHLMYLPERHNLVLSKAKNTLGECTVVVARRPGLVEGRGQFDDVLWTQVARNRFANLAMAAAEQASEAPLAVPYDVQELPLGPLALLRSASPEKIRRVATELPQAAFAESQLLDSELRTGARYPQTRTGNLDSSIITGQGVRALEGGFDSQIRAAQDVFASAFREAMRISLKMDEHYWHDDERSIRGNQDGVPYEIRWKPSRDIDGDHSCDVSYGFAVGLDPNRSLVFILQMLGARLISKDMARRQFPFGINVTQEEQRITVEDLRDSLVQSLAGYAQTIPMLAQQGMDPTEAVSRIARIIKGAQKGRPLEDVVTKAFAPPEPPPGSTTPGSELTAPGLGGSPGGGAPAPGQAQMGPGGQPDLMTMLAGLNSGGAPTTNVNVKRAMPAY
jgi:hypothetical protein